MITRALRFGEPLPECGIAPVVRKELRKKRVSDFGSARHIVERGDHVKHGPRLELAEFSLRLVAHIVRCWPGIKDRMVPQAAVVRTAVAKDMTILAPVDVAQAGYDGRFTVLDLGIEVLVEVAAVGSMLVGNSPGALSLVSHDEASAD